MSQIIAFGDPEYVGSIGDPRESNPFFRVHRHIQDRARAAGRSFRDQAGVELERATDHLTLKGYVDRVRRNLRSYWLDSEAFMKRFERISRAGGRILPPDGWRGIFESAERLNRGVWRVLLSLGILLFAIPVSADRRSLILSMLYKYVFFFFSLQPFFAVAHGRYYVQYVPFIAMAAGAAIVAVREGRFWPSWSRPGLDGGIVLAGQLLAMASATAILMLILVEA